LCEMLGIVMRRQNN